MSSCPVCESNLIGGPGGYGSGQNDLRFHHCPKCGCFEMELNLSYSFHNYILDKKDCRIKLSYAIRKMQRKNSTPKITWENLDGILNFSLPTPKEQADNFIRWFAENHDNPGVHILVKFDDLSSIMGTKTKEGFSLVLNYLIQIGLLQVQSDTTTNQGFFITLSIKGWDYYNELKKGGGSYRQAFMAMMFGDPTLDMIFKDVFKFYVEQAGFELIRLDNNPKAVLIDDRLRVEIQNADFLIADLTHDNNGAYWEAGYAEGLGKPVIYTCEKELFESKKSTHFDTNHHLTIIWDKNTPNEAGERLKDTIRATLPHIAKMKDELIKTVRRQFNE